ncbi:retrovirus-related pol polyprotein from transposon TNT 1-94 [Tanacetum coccineum]
MPFYFSARLAMSENGFSVGRDGNNHIFPVAWVVVSVEDKENWSWFLQLLVDDLEVPNGNGLTLMSDQHKGLIEAVKDVMPLAEFNVLATSMKDSGSSLVKANPRAHQYLLEKDPKTWSRAFFTEGRCYEAVENGFSFGLLFLVVTTNLKLEEVLMHSRYMLTYSHYLKPIDGINFWPDCSHLSRILGPKPRKMPGRMGIWLGMDGATSDPIEESQPFQSSLPAFKKPLNILVTNLLVLPLCLLKTFCPRSNLECKSANKCQRQEESITNAIRSWGVPGGSLQLVRETLAESGPHMLDLDREDLDLTKRNLKQCKRKICDGHYTADVRVLSSLGSRVFPEVRHVDAMDCVSGAAVAISDELVSSITQVVNLFLEGNCPTVLGGYIASAPLTPLVKPGGGIRPIAVGTIWRRLVSKVSATMIGHSLDGYLDGLQFGVGVPGGGEAILHAVNHLVEDRGDDVGLSMLLVDFQNAFNLVDRTVMLEEVCLRCPAISRWVEFCYSSLAKLYYREHSLCSCQGAWYLDDDTIVGDTLVVGKVLELIMEDGPRYGLHLNVDKTELFWPKEDPRSRLEGIFPHNISRPLHGVKLLGGSVSMDVDFGSALVMKRVSKTIGLLDAVAKINDPQCELLLIWACEGRIVMASGSGFGDWKWRLATLPFAFGGLGIYSAGDVLNYAFIASRLQSATLQTKLLRDVGIVALGSTFDDALCVFNNAMEIDFLSNPSEVAAPKLMKKMADIYFTRVTKDAESSYSLSPRQIALWQSQKEDHTSDWLRVVPISGLGQIMNGKTYRSILCYRLGVPLFSVSKPCSACSKVFIEDIYGDHAISCAGIIGIKHRHNMVRDTLVDISHMPLYSWDGGLDVCVDLTGSSPLTQTGMSDFAPGRAVTDAAQRKRGKYMTKCADIGYGFLPFSFSSFGELEKDAVTLLKRVRNFSMAQDIGARAASHIFNRIGFSIAKGVGAQIVSRLPSNVL